MKKNLKSLTALIICFIMVASILAACGKKDETESTTTTAVTWAQDGSYQPVQVGATELKAIVDGALGEDSDFDGDLGSLTDDEYSKVIEYAQQQGYEVTEGDNKGDTVLIKNPNKATTAATTTKAAADSSAAGTTKKTTTSATQTDRNGNPVTVATKTTKATTDASRGSTKATSAGRTTTPAVSGGATTTKKATTKANTTKAGGGSVNGGGGGTSYSNTTVTTTKATVYNGISLDVANGYYNSSACNFIAAKTSSDGGAIAVGTTTADASGKALSYSAGLIEKFNADGSKGWVVVTAANDSTSYEDVAILSDGSIIVVGYTMSTNITEESAYRCKDTVEGVITKFDATGKKLWTKIFGGSKSDIIYSVAATPDGGFLIGGKTNSTDFDLKDTGAGKVTAFYAKYASNGQRMWTKTLTGSMHCAVFDIAVTSDGSAYLAIESLCKDGDFASIDGSQTGRKYSVAVKIGSDGEIKWTKGIWESGTVSLKKVIVANDGGCVLAGTYTSTATGNSGSFSELYNGGPAGTTDGIIYKLNGNGQRVWATPLVGYESDYVTDIAAVKSGYVVTGYTKSTNRDFAFTNKGDYDSFVYVYSNYGVRQAAKGFGGSASDRAMCVCATGKTVYVMGNSNSTNGEFANATVKSDGKKVEAFFTKFTLSLQA